MPPVKLLLTQDLPIFTQLQIEEAYLRTSHENLIVINQGSPEAIVMGIASKAHEMIDPRVYETNPCPIIQRFSGGGTVLVDDKTLFVSFILNQEPFALELMPDSIARFAFTLLKPWLKDDTFELKENDFVLGSLKVGGNAQYIQRKRFVHHTTFLFDYCPQKMALLSQPKKQPSYRKYRKHEEFLTRLNTVFSTIEEAKNQLVDLLETQFKIEALTLEQALKQTEQEHRKSTCLIPSCFSTAGS